MTLTPAILSLFLLGLVHADREWLPDERSAGPQLTEKQLENKLTEWLERKMELQALARARAQADSLESRLEQAAAMWNSHKGDEYFKYATPGKDVGHGDVAADNKYTAGEKEVLDSDVAADSKWPDYFTADEDRVLPIGRQVNAKASPVEDSPSPEGHQGKSNEDFTFAVGPDDPRFFNKKFEKSEEEDAVAEVQRDDIDIDGEEQTDDDRSAAVVQVPMHQSPLTPLAFIAIVAACCAAGVLVIVLLGVCSYKLQRKAKAAADVEYPAYGVTGPSKDVSPGSSDKRLAQSAQMYHYQHQKQQIIAMERASNERHGSISEPESEDDMDEGDHIVYECPGLASTREMEVKNPLFLDDNTPMSPARHTLTPQPTELPK